MLPREYFAVLGGGELYAVVFMYDAFAVISAVLASSTRERTSARNLARLNMPKGAPGSLSIWYGPADDPIFPVGPTKGKKISLK
jgi:hypothetical protein